MQVADQVKVFISIEELTAFVFKVKICIIKTENDDFNWSEECRTHMP